VHKKFPGLFENISTCVCHCMKYITRMRL